MRGTEPPQQRRPRAVPLLPAGLHEEVFCRPTGPASLLFGSVFPPQRDSFRHLNEPVKEGADNKGEREKERDGKNRGKKGVVYFGITETE